VERSRVLSGSRRPGQAPAVQRPCRKRHPPYPATRCSGCSPWSRSPPPSRAARPWRGSGPAVRGAPRRSRYRVPEHVRRLVPSDLHRVGLVHAARAKVRRGRVPSVHSGALSSCPRTRAPRTCRRRLRRSVASQGAGGCPCPGTRCRLSPRPTTSTESARRRAGGGAVPPWSRAFWRIDDGRVNAQSARPLAADFRASA